MTTHATEAAITAFRKREGLQRILASRLAAQRPVPATAVLKCGISETAIAGVLAHV